MQSQHADNKVNNTSEITMRFKFAYLLLSLLLLFLVLLFFKCP